MCESSYTTHINTTLLYKQYSHYHHYTYHYSALQVPEGLALFDLLQLPPAGILKVLYLTSQLLREFDALEKFAAKLLVKDTEAAPSKISLRLSFP